MSQQTDPLNKPSFTNLVLIAMQKKESRPSRSFNEESSFIDQKPNGNFTASFIQENHRSPPESSSSSINSEGDHTVLPERNDDAVQIEVHSPEEDDETPGTSQRGAATLSYAFIL